MNSSVAAIASKPSAVSPDSKFNPQPVHSTVPGRITAPHLGQIGPVFFVKPASSNRLSNLFTGCGAATCTAAAGFDLAAGALPVDAVAALVGLALAAGAAVVFAAVGFMVFRAYQGKKRRD